ncbi:MAG: putative membrane protein [Myxococcota bacterium]|jgi:putative membrane protein
MTAEAIAVGVVAALHVWFLVFEMFLWTSPLARKTFGMTEQLANDSKVLAANQGIYNGVFAAGLVLSLVVDEPVAYAFKVFFLAGVIVVGLYGALSASWKILLMQVMPGAIGLFLVLSHYGVVG